MVDKVVKKSVSFNPEVFKALVNYQRNRCREEERPVSFSEVVNELLKVALEGEIRRNG